MEILIVGGTGVISYAVVLESLKQGIDVTCVNRGRSKSQVLPNDVKTIIADYHDENKMRTLLRGKHYDAVIDVLCFKPSDIEYSVSLFKDVCSQYVFFSSCAVYNKGNGDYVCDEDSPLVNPVWDYSINKVACENKLKELATKNNLFYTIVRPAVTYGNTRIPYGITPPYGYHGTLIQRILKHKPIVLWDGGKAYSTITRVEDFAVGLVGLLGNPKAYNEAFNIVGDERYHWIEVVEKLGEILNCSPTYVNLTKEQLAKEMPHRKGEILGGRGISQLLDNSKLKTAVPNFRTSISLTEGLRKTINYYLEHDYLSGIDYSFDAVWDRIAKRYAPQEFKNIGFIDYLGNATQKDHVTYYMHQHWKRVDIKCLRFGKRVLEKGKAYFLAKREVSR